MSALRKMTVLPANRLNLGLKGRIKIGADADITIFDPARVIDKATFEKPDQYSEGITHVLVNGVFVVRDGRIVEGVKPGIGITSVARHRRIDRQAPRVNSAGHALARLQTLVAEPVHHVQAANTV